MYVRTYVYIYIYGDYPTCMTSEVYISLEQILQQAYPLPLKDDTEKDSFHLGYWRDLGYASKVCMFKSSENLI